MSTTRMGRGFLRNEANSGSLRGKRAGGAGVARMARNSSKETPAGSSRRFSRMDWNWRGAAPGGEKTEGLALSDPAAEAAGVGWKIGLHKRLTWTAEASAFLGRGAVETKTSYQPKTAEASAVLRLWGLADHGSWSSPHVFQGAVFRERSYLASG